MGRREVYIGFGWRNLMVTDHLKDPGIDGTIILKWIFRKWDGAETELNCLRIGAGCECGNELSGSIKCGGFLDLL
jgi:hypothetical protein